MLAEGDDKHGFMKHLLSHQAVACKSEPCFSQNLPKLAQQALLYSCRKVLGEFFNENT